MAFATESSKDTRVKEQPAIVWGVAIGLGLSLGFLDVMVSLLPSPPGLAHLGSVAAPLATTTLVFLLLYGLTWRLFLRPLGARLHWRTVPLAAAYAVLLGTSFLLALLNNLIDFPLNLNQLFELALLLIVVLFLSVTTYVAGRTFGDTVLFEQFIGLGCLTLPILLLETTAALWLHKYVLGSFWSFSALLLTAGYVVVMGLTVAGAVVLGSRIKILAWLMVFLVAVVLSPMIGFFVPTAGKGRPEGPTQAERGVNSVVLLTVDTLRADALSVYGSRRVKTPHMDALAQDGVLFRNAFAAAPWTLPSLASILTGLSPVVHQTKTINHGLPGEVETLAERLRDAGYVTAAIGYNLFLDPTFRLSQGFMGYRHYPEEIGLSFGARVLYKLLPQRFFPSTDSLASMSVEWLEENHEQRFFLWIHFYDPHDPYAPPEEYLPVGPAPTGMGPSYVVGQPFTYAPVLVEREWAMGLYEGEVQYVDSNIGKVLDALKRLGLYEESLIVLTSDHGEEFWEHGGTDHGLTLFDEVLRVPLIVKLPQNQPTQEVLTPVANAAVMPSILDLCGVAHDHDQLSYESLVSLWGEEPGSGDAPPVVSTGLYQRQRTEEDSESVVFGEYKYIRSLLTGQEELYDLRRDPRERLSLVASEPVILEQGRDLLVKHEEASLAVRRKLGIRAEKIELREQMLERLRGLGYVQ